MGKVRDVICLSVRDQSKRFFRASKSKLIKFRSAKVRKRSGSSKLNFGSSSILMACFWGYQYVYWDFFFCPMLAVKVPPTQSKIMHGCI